MEEYYFAQMAWKNESITTIYSTKMFFNDTANVVNERKGRHRKISGNVSRNKKQGFSH